VKIQSKQPQQIVVQEPPPQPTIIPSPQQLINQIQLPANPSPGPITLSAEETMLLKELNRARTNPREYADILEQERRPYFEGTKLIVPGTNIALATQEGVKAVDEAITFLRTFDQSLSPFQIGAGMTKAARETVREVGISGGTACGSITRMDKYGRWEGEVVELAGFGSPDPKEIVMRFLVGDGNSARTHRQYIFNPKFKRVGVSVGPHNSNFKFMCCVNFSFGFADT